MNRTYVPENLNVDDTHEVSKLYRHLLATHHFGKKIVCRDEKKGSETSNRAVTHHFSRKTVYREHT